MAQDVGLAGDLGHGLDVGDGEACVARPHRKRGVGCVKGCLVHVCSSVRSLTKSSIPLTRWCYASSSREPGRTMATVNGDVDVSQVKGTPLPAGQEAGTAEKAARDRARIRRGIVCTLLGGALWGLNGTVSKFLMDAYGMEPLWLVCVRELTACWLFLAAAAASADGRSKLRAVTHDAHGMLEILAVALGAVLFSQVAYLQAINWTSSATATIMQSLGMLLVLAYVCLAMRRRPRRREVLGIALALVGTFLVATGGNPAELALPWAAWSGAWSAPCPRPASPSCRQSPWPSGAISSSTAWRFWPRAPS